MDDLRVPHYRRFSFGFRFRRRDCVRSFQQKIQSRVCFTLQFKILNFHSQHVIVSSFIILVLNLFYFYRFCSHAEGHPIFEDPNSLKEVKPCLQLQKIAIHVRSCMFDQSELCANGSGVTTRKRKRKRIAIHLFVPIDSIVQIIGFICYEIQLRIFGF